MPVAAYGGARALMENVSPLGPAYQAGTLSGNPIGMAAGLATLNLCGAEGFYDTLEHISTRLSEGLASASSDAGISLHTGATGGMLGMSFSDGPVRDFSDADGCDHARFTRFFWAMLERGVWLPPSGYEAMFVSAAHDAHIIDQVLHAARESFGISGA